MPKGSEELTAARKDEIITACAALYKTMRFKDITIKDIGDATSFTRTSIYNYFQTKEEIFLALLQREYTSWIHSLEQIRSAHARLTPSAFASALAHSLEERADLLKLLAMNLYDIEENCRLDRLVAFKRVYGQSLTQVERCLAQYFPGMTAQERQDFLYLFFPFMFGIYPYTMVTPKQQEAMAQAGIDYPEISIYEIARAQILKLLGVADETSEHMETVRAGGNHK